MRLLIGRGQMVCNPLGYPGGSGQAESLAFDPNLVMEV